jgi:hypothetical protein
LSGKAALMDRLSPQARSHRVSFRTRIFNVEDAARLAVSPNSTGLFVAPRIAW